MREFQPGDEDAFRQLNEEWIGRYFQMEPKDRAIFADPQRSILDPGGRILLAASAGRTIGCCALIRMDDTQFEVGKMAVAPEFHGLGIGRKLLLAAIDMGRQAGARRLYLETNNILAAAIHLYESVGFRHIDPSRIKPSPYQRSNTYMELLLV